MAKGSNTSKCPETEFVCKRKTDQCGSVVTVSRSVYNGGFSLTFDVSLFGKSFDKSEISDFGDRISLILKNMIKSHIQDTLYEVSQLEFDF